MAELRSNWGAGWIAGLGPKLLDAENQGDVAYSMSIPDALGVEKNKYTALLKEISTTQARETMSGKTSAGELQQTDEGEDYKSNERETTYEVQINPQKFTGALRISEENRDDRDFDIRGKLDEARDLKVAYNQTVNKHGYSVFNYGTTAQASLPDHLSYYADGKPVFDDNHPIKATITSTTTQDNKSTVLFSEVNLETGRQALLNQMDDRGMLASYGGSNIILLVPPALEKNAVMVTKSTKRSGTANNDLNVYDGMVTVMSTKWIGTNATSGSSTAWYVIDSLHSPFMFVNRRGYTSKMWEDNSNKDIVYDCSARYQVGNREWKGSWGSAGTG